MRSEPATGAEPPTLPRPRAGLLLPTHVVERRDAAGRVEQRGVLGRLDVSGADSGHVLPHTRVAEAGVAWHTRLLGERAGSGVLLLAAPDLGGFRAGVTAFAAGRPHRRIRTAEAGELRLWPCPRRWRSAPPPLGPVLLADGHHRLEAARRLQRGRAGREHRLPALVVDHARYPLRLAATHRAVPGLDLVRALAFARRFGRVRPRGAGTAGRPPPRGSFLLTGPGGGWEVSGLSPALLASRFGGLPADWVDLDAAVSDHVLIPSLCEDQGLAPDFRYTTARPGPGEAGVVLPAPTWDQVWGGAASGAGMPVKSTRLGPEPPADLLRHLG